MMTRLHYEDGLLVEVEVREHYHCPCGCEFEKAKREGRQPLAVGFHVSDVTAYEVGDMNDCLTALDQP